MCEIFRRYSIIHNSAMYHNENSRQTIQLKRFHYTVSKFTSFVNKLNFRQKTDTSSSFPFLSVFTALKGIPLWYFLSRNIKKRTF